MVDELRNDNKDSYPGSNRTLLDFCIFFLFLASVDVDKHAENLKRLGNFSDLFLRKLVRAKD